MRLQEAFLREDQDEHLRYALSAVDSPPCSSATSRRVALRTEKTEKPTKTRTILDAATGLPRHSLRRNRRQNRPSWSWTNHPSQRTTLDLFAFRRLNLPPLKVRRPLTSARQRQSTAPLGCREVALWAAVAIPSLVPLNSAANATENRPPNDTLLEINNRKGKSKKSNQRNNTRITGNQSYSRLI